MSTIVGIDEAGRGPLAGPVVAAAVILPAEYDLPRLTDSKKLTEKQRNILFTAIQEQAVAYAIAEVSAAEIDVLNIHHASLLAMQRAYQALGQAADLALVDGKFCPDLPCYTQAIIKGDSKEPAISAASILAKVSRDRLLQTYEVLYPQYGFARHKGYGTKQHLEALAAHGPCPEHRQSYAPVKNSLRKEKISD